jgi:hypothetical protein
MSRVALPRGDEAGWWIHINSVKKHLYKHPCEEEGRSSTCVMLGVIDEVRPAEMTPDMVVPSGKIVLSTNLLRMNPALAPFTTSTAEKPSKSAKVHPADAFLFKFGVSPKPEITRGMNASSNTKLNSAVQNVYL